MNKQKKARLEQALALIRQARDVIKEVRAEEEKVYDNLPDGIRNGKRGNEMDRTNHILDEVFDYLDITDDVLQYIWKDPYGNGKLPF